MQENKAPLSRGQIADAVYEKFQKDFASKAAADRVVAGVFDEMVAAIADGRGIQVDKLGSFAIAETAARTGRNPRTKEPVEIPAGVKVRYKASKPMKDAARSAPRG